MQCAQELGSARTCVREDWTIQDDGQIVTRDGGGDEMHRMNYTVSKTTEDGTTLIVTADNFRAEWRVSADGKELHGATSPAKIVFRRK